MSDRIELYVREPEFAMIRGQRKVRSYRHRPVHPVAVFDAADLVGISVDTALMFLEAIAAPVEDAEIDEYGEVVTAAEAERLVEAFGPVNA